MMKVNNNKAVQEALSCDLLKTIISDVKDWAAALPYRANGKHRMANQILGLDGVLSVQSHFNQHRDKAPDYMSVELLALMSCVRLTGQEASRLLKAYQGEMFPAAALFLLRAGIDVNKLPALTKGFHKQDRKMLTVGEWSACCQKLGGAGAMAIALCKASTKADTYAISVAGEDCGSMVVFALSDGCYVIDSIERRRVLSDEAIEALLKKLAANHKVYAGYNLEGRFSLNYDTEDYLSKANHQEWKELYTFAEEFYVDTCPKVWRIVP